MTKGIYCYYDNLRCEIVYVGKDSNIDKNKRHKDHYTPSLKSAQRINGVLQNDNKSGRYSYAVLEQGDFTDDELNQKEISWIKFFNPRFNFTEGGEGALGYKHTEESLKKMRKNHADFSGEKHPMFNKKHTKKSLQKMSEAKLGEKNPMYGKKGKNHPQFNPCIKIKKRKDKTCTQGFIWRATVRISGKPKDICRVDLQKCIKKVQEFIDSERNVYGYDSFEVIYRNI